MPFQQVETVRYFVFESLAEHGVRHGAITRRGGASPSPWSSLNVGGTVGDQVDRVAENRRRTFRALGRDQDSIYDVWQVHGHEVVCAEAPRPPGARHLRADAILTDRPQVSLFMRFADCVPIFLYDPIRRVVGLAHAGWQGTVKRVAARAVEVMAARYGSCPENILAGIGPSIGVHHYEVGLEVASQVQRAFGQEASSLLIDCDGDGDDFRVQFDLWAANQLILEKAGVRQVEVSSICTACYLDDWYSHRAENGCTGRFGALIAL
jgi:YfiH family protein